jgi:hypothetical protein
MPKEEYTLSNTRIIPNQEHCDNKNWEKVIDKTSVFDSPPYYQKEKIAEVLTEAGAINVHFEHSSGWSNQPEVVIFKGLTCNEAENIIKENAEVIHPSIKTWGVIARVKYWRNRKSK